MLLAGGIIVVLTFALIIKKIEARLVLFLAGVIMCLIGGLPGDIMKAFMKAMTNNSLVPTICTVMGFSYVSLPGGLVWQFRLLPAVRLRWAVF